MRITKDFVAKIAIGIKGVAVLEISETLSPDSIYVGSDIEPNLILDDIEQCGIEDWAEYCLDDIPKNPGIYTFRGKAEFSEDDADYNVTCDDV